MTGLLRTQLTGLAARIVDLKERVRLAVAGELSRAVSGAVQQMVQVVVAGRVDPTRSDPSPSPRRSTTGRWDDEDDRWDRPRDPWSDEDDGFDRNRVDRPDTSARHESPPPNPPPAGPHVTAAVAAGVYAARWWLVRTGTWLAAAGVGLAVGLFGLVGGPVARTAVAIVATVGDILGATDALGGAARLRHL